MPIVQLGWGQLRLSIKGLMLAVAAVAIVFCGRWVYWPRQRWRLHLDRLIVGKLAGPHDPPGHHGDLGYRGWNGLGESDYRDVLSDPRYVAERLFVIRDTDGVNPGRSAPLLALESYLAEAADPDLATEFMDRALRQALSGTLTSGDETSCVWLVKRLGMTLGLDERQRSAILERTRALAHDPGAGERLPEWLSLVGAVGGRAEISLLLELGDPRDPTPAEGLLERIDETESVLIQSNRRSRLRMSRVATLLDHVRRSIDNRADALAALDYSILPCTVAGRRLLLEVVLDPRRDDAVRQKAMRLLKRQRAGIELLLNACKDPAHRRILGRLYGPEDESPTRSPVATSRKRDNFWPTTVKNADDPRPELLKLSKAREKASISWDDVLEGLHPLSWAYLDRMRREGTSAAVVAATRQAAFNGTLTIARELAGRNDLATLQDWRHWRRTTNPPPIARERWLDRLLAHPELMAFAEFSRFIPSGDSVAPDSIPVLARLARSAPAGKRWIPGKTLLLYCDRVEEAPLLIGDIEQELRDHPRWFAERNTMPIQVLRDRFGVNHFWDVAAWRRWWAEYDRGLRSRPPGTEVPSGGKG
jgi:hypothetical protein